MPQHIDPQQLVIRLPRPPARFAVVQGRKWMKAIVLGYFNSREDAAQVRESMKSLQHNVRVFRVYQCRCTVCAELRALEAVPTR